MNTNFDEGIIKMYYHATQVKGIQILEPRISDHEKPLIYFSDRRENVLVYLSNAVEKFCKENNFEHNGTYSKWGPYGFNKDGIIQIEEYYPNALFETYKGVEGYIYKTRNIPNMKMLNDIPNAYIASTNTKIDEVEYITDAYEAIIEEVKKGNIILVRYEEFIKLKQEWLERTIIKEYAEAVNKPEYRYFLENKFDFIKNKKCDIEYKKEVI